MSDATIVLAGQSAHYPGLARHGIDRIRNRGVRPTALTDQPEALSVRGCDCGYLSPNSRRNCGAVSNLV